MQTLFKKKKINISIDTLQDAPKASIATPVNKNNKVNKAERKVTVKIILIIIRLLVLLAICAAVYYKVGNLYALSLVFFFTFLFFFFAPEEIFLVTSLLTVICAVLYLLGYDLYYIKVGEFIFISLSAGVLKVSKALFEKE